jgi:hypothetical protein
MRGLRHPVPMRAARPSKMERLLEKTEREAEREKAGAESGAAEGMTRAESRAEHHAEHAELRPDSRPELRAESRAELRAVGRTENRADMDTQRGPFAEASVRRVGPRTNGRLEALEPAREKAEKRPDSRTDLPHLEPVPAVATASEVVWARPADPGGAR